MVDIQNYGIRPIYERDDFSSYLVIKPEVNKLLNYQVEMIINNRIPGLLPMDLRRKNNETCLYYNITSQMPLSQFLSRKKINKEEFVNLLSQITGIMLSGVNYLLYNKCYILRVDYIYINPANFEINMVYIPAIMDEEVNQILRKFVINLIVNTAYIEDENTGDNFIQKIINYLKGETFNINGFNRLLMQLSTGGNQDEYTNTEDQMSIKSAPDTMGMDGVSDIGSANSEAALEEKTGKVNSWDEVRCGKGDRGKGTEIDDKGKQCSYNTNDEEQGGLLGNLILNHSKISGKVWMAIGSQLIILILILLSKKFFESLNGNIKTTYAAVALIIIAIDTLLFKNLFGMGKTVDKPQSSPEGMCFTSGTQNISSKNINADNMNTQHTNIREDMNTQHTNAWQDMNAQSNARQGINSEEQPYRGLNLSGFGKPEKQITREPISKEPMKSNSYFCHEAKTALDYGGKTVLLSGKKEQKPMIINMKGNLQEEVPVNKADFLIGRLENQVDYTIKNDTIGKVHAQIITRENRYYLKDLNSRNGTFINDIRIDCNTENEIKDGDRITFADMDYLFVVRYI